MAETVRTVRAKLTVDGEEAKQDLQKITQAAEDFGESGAKAATAMTNKFQQIEAASERVTAKITAGKAITNRDVGAMGFAFETLKDDIDKAFGSVEKAPAVIQTAFAKAEAQVSKTKDSVRLFRASQQDLNAELDVSGQRFTSLSDLVGNRLGPAMEKTIGQMGAFTAALVGSYTATIALERGAGVSMEAYDEWKADMLKNLGAVLNGFTDLVAGVKDWDTNNQDMRGHLKLTTETMDGFNEALKAGLPVIEALRTPEGELAELHRLHALALSGGAAGMQLYNEKMKEVGGNIPAFIKSLEESEPALKKHAEEVKKASEEYNSLANQVKRAAGENVALQKAYEAEAALLKTKTGNSADAAAAMEKELDRLKALVAEGPAAIDGQKIFATALHDTVTATDLLTQKQKDAITTILDQAAKTGGLAAAQVTNIEQTIKAAEKTNALAEAHEKLPEAIAKARSALGEDIYAKALEGVRAMNTELETAVTRIGTELPAAVSVAEQALTRLKNIAAETAGSGEGLSPELTDVTRKKIAEAGKK